MEKVKKLIDELELLPHPEGGWYKEVYRANEQIEVAGLPERFGGSRSFSTSIYFLLAGDNFSAFHRIKSDELWHFYSGDGLTIHTLASNGEHRAIQLGNRLEMGETFQAVVPAGLWFASEPNGDENYALVGCTVAPGFDFADFEMAKRTSLQQQFPEHCELIKRLTR